MEDIKTLQALKIWKYNYRNVKTSRFIASLFVTVLSLV
jgi:hypothetical protein